MDLTDMLRAAGAPGPLVEWAPKDVSKGFEHCPSGMWLIWLAGSSGFPLETLSRCVLSLNDEAIEHIGAEFVNKDLIMEALDIAEDYLEGGETSADDCVEIAEECEAAADAPPAQYRDATPPGYDDLCRAAAWMAKATDGFEAARIRAEAPRLEHASHMGSLLGTGSDIFIPNEQELAINPAELDQNTQESFLYVVASLAESVRHIEQAHFAASPSGEGTSKQQSAQWAADRLRAIAQGDDDD